RLLQRIEHHQRPDVAGVHPVGRRLHTFRNVRRIDFTDTDLSGRHDWAPFTVGRRSPSAGNSVDLARSDRTPLRGRRGPSPYFQNRNSASALAAVALPLEA